MNLSKTYRTKFITLVSKYWEPGSIFINKDTEHHLILAMLSHRNRSLTPDDKRKQIADKVTADIKESFPEFADLSVKWSTTDSDTVYERLTIGVVTDINVAALAGKADAKINYKLAEVYPAPHNLTCPFCNQPALYSATSKFLYGGRDYGSVYFCMCKPDGVYVGCHKGTSNPLGELCDSEVRLLRMECHKLFDPYWQSFTNLTKKQQNEMRNTMYKNLAKIMKIEPSKCHISMFDKQLCEQAIGLLKAKKMNQFLSPLQQLKLAFSK